MTVHGILVQLPLPPHLDEKVITDAVSPFKDVDGQDKSFIQITVRFHSLNAGLLAKRNSVPMFIACTPKGVMKLIQSTGKTKQIIQ